MAEGRTWTEHATRLLLQIWSEEDPASAAGGSKEECRISDNYQRAGKARLSAYTRAMSAEKLSRKGTSPSLTE